MYAEVTNMGKLMDWKMNYFVVTLMLSTSHFPTTDLSENCFLLFGAILA